MQANIDGCVNTGNGYAILEIKNCWQLCRSRLGRWTAGRILPTNPALPCSYRCGQSYVAVLLGGNKFQYQEVNRDDEIITNIVAMEKDFGKIT